MLGLNDTFGIEMVLKSNTLFDYGMRYYIKDKSLLESVLLNDLKGFLYERKLETFNFLNIIFDTLSKKLIKGGDV